MFTLLLLTTFANTEAQLARVFAVKSLPDRFRQRAGLRKLRQHSHPSDRLEREPVSAQHDEQGEQAAHGG